MRDVSPDATSQVAVQTNAAATNAISTTETRPNVKRTLSQQARLAIMMALVASFLVLELVVGKLSGSVALVTDAFHMLSDFISLGVAYSAIYFAAQKSSNPQYTYGYARAEIIGALINAVALLALCFSVTIEAIERLFEPAYIRSPKYVLFTGCIGLLMNIIGLFLFKDHADVEHDNTDLLPSDAQITTREMTPTLTMMYPGIDTAYHTTKYKDTIPICIQDIDRTNDVDDDDTGDDRCSRSYETIDLSDTDEKDGTLCRDKDTHDMCMSVDMTERCVSGGEYGSPKLSLRTMETSLDDGHDGDTVGRVSSRCGSDASSIQVTSDAIPTVLPGNGHASQPDHVNLNMQGVFLHVMGDALGSIGVIVSSTLILVSTGTWKYYLDPIMSIVIACIIVWTNTPLVWRAVFILLQSAPETVNVDAVCRDIVDVDGVVGVHDLHVWQLSDAKMVASVHVVIVVDDIKSNSQSSRLSYMETAKRIKDAMHHHGIHDTTIQPEFISIETLSTWTTRASLYGTGDNHGDDTDDNGGLIHPTHNTNTTLDIADVCFLSCQDGSCGHQHCQTPSQSSAIATY